MTDYDEQWLYLFMIEKENLEAVMGPVLKGVHHIGSTSVPGLKAKPVIDIMPIVENIGAVDSYNGALAEIGYEALGEYGISGRRYFRKGGDDRTHNVHIFEAGSHHISRHLAFRDYLKSHEEAREQYGKLKEALAEQFPHDIDGYMDGKDDFIKRTERAAMNWYRE